ncbi:acetyltransferase [Vagococcus carniphilus]|uniref:acetyltransferase n=1 Tax=Vagococcus carniphilus TaxID=218144 RepID=UPI00288E803D|nr:acetyltransferase [Vagococcus carniphilus]MDT2813654.1 acetyltransferase [Vagococcus carniphilus]
MKNLVIIGAGGHGKVCAELAKDMDKWEGIFFLDDSYPQKKSCLNFKIIDVVSAAHKYKEKDFFVAIGDNRKRQAVLELLKKNKLNIVSLVHPTAYISQFTKIGYGTSVHQNCVLNTDSKIGVGCIINTSTVVEHDNQIGDYVHLSPNVTLGGNVSIGNFCWIGIGSTIINNVKVEKNVILGAHSLILNEVKSDGVYYGVPSKKWRE